MEKQIYFLSKIGESIFMYKSSLTAIIFFLSLITSSTFSQTWSGSTIPTGLAYRNGQVIVGGTTMVGSFGPTAGVIEIQGEESYLSMAPTNGPIFQFGASVYGSAFYSKGAPIKFWTGPNKNNSGFAQRMMISTTGDVGIGTNLTTNPNGYKLAVNGKIGAKEVQVENTSSTWADYVFEPDYKLISLQEVESFIKTHKHLPEIPSAEEVKTNGHKLGEMDVLLLKKVEELTLYMIELKKEIKNLKLENDTMKREIDELKKL